MGFLTRFLSGPLGLYAIIAVAVLLAGSMTYGYVQHANAERYQLERDTARGENKRLLTAVQSKDGVIDDLTKALQLWQTRATESAKASTEAGQRAEQYQSQLNAARGRIRALSEVDRGNPACDALLNTDLGAVCAGHSERVRQWAAGRVQGSTDQRSNANGTAR